MVAEGAAPFQAKRRVRLCILVSAARRGACRGIAGGENSSPAPAGLPGAFGFGRSDIESVRCP